jgi:hypothetical protein
MGTKISNLNELTAPTDGDFVPVVDSSATTTKKVDISNFMLEGVADHNADLVGLQGGTTDEYYHLPQTYHDYVKTLTANPLDQNDLAANGGTVVVSEDIGTAARADLTDDGGSVLSLSDLVANDGSVPEVDRSNTFTGTTQTVNGALVVGSGASSNGAGTASFERSLFVGKSPTAEFDQAGVVHLSQDAPGSNYRIGGISSQWNGNEVARIEFRSGDDSTNKDDGEMMFRVAEGGGLSTALRIDQDAGVYTPNATGGSQGADTINAQAVYDDSDSICLPIAEAIGGNTDPNYWHGLSTAGNNPLVAIHDQYKQDGWDGTAASFVSLMEKHGATPGLHTPEEIAAQFGENGVEQKISLTDKMQRQWLAMDYVSVAISDIEHRLQTLESKLGDF